MPALREELTKKGIEASDDNAVLYAMFPRETEALYKKPATPAPAPRPIEVASRPSVSSTNGIHPPRRFFITINSRRSEVLVEEIA